MKKYIPGIIVTLVIAIVARYLCTFVSMVEGITMSIILGMIIGNLTPAQSILTDGVKFSEKTILNCAIVLMGFKLNLFALGKMGTGVFAIVLPAMAVTIITSLLLGKLFGYPRRFSLLMGAGNAVCGSSAIAAVGPAVQANEEEMGVSIGIVNLLGTVGIFLVPMLVLMLHLPDEKSSYIVGGVLQSIGQVTAAGFSVNEHVGDLATLVKMLRVLMIGPVVILSSFICRSAASGKTKKLFIPGYIIGFVICSVLSSIFSDDTVIIPHLKTAAKFLLMIAMAGVGMRIHFASLLKHGPQALLFGTLIAVVQIIFVTIIVLALI